MPIETKKSEAIIAAIERGMPLETAAYLVKLEPSQVQDEIDSNPEFLRAVNHATAKCMDTLLQKLEKLDNWQAVAFLLISIWPHRFGRHARNTRRKGAQRRRPRVRPDISKLTLEQQRALDKLLGIVHGRQSVTVTVGKGIRKCLPGLG